MASSNTITKGTCRITLTLTEENINQVSGVRDIVATFMVERLSGITYWETNDVYVTFTMGSQTVTYNPFNFPAASTSAKCAARFRSVSDTSITVSAVTNDTGTSVGALSISHSMELSPLGVAVLNSVDDIYIDQTDIINFTAEWPSTSATYTLNVVRSAVTPTTLYSVSVSSGTTKVALPASVLTTIAGYMTSVNPNVNLYLQLVTTISGTSYSSYGECKALLYQPNPEIGEIAVTDTSSSIVQRITGDSSIIVQNLSRARITIPIALACGATLGSIVITCGSHTETYTSVASYYDFGACPEGSLTIKVTDSRGYVTKTTKDYIFYTYSKPKFSVTLSRSDGGIGETVTMKVSGSFSKIGNNGLLNPSAYYVNSTSHSFTPTVSGATFSYSATLSETYSADTEYTFNVSISDLLLPTTVSVVLPKGSPVVCIQGSKVGIETAPSASDDSAVQVYGSVTASGTVKANALTIGGYTTAQVIQQTYSHSGTGTTTWTQTLIRRYSDKIIEVFHDFPLTVAITTACATTEGYMSDLQTVNLASIVTDLNMSIVPMMFVETWNASGITAIASNVVTGVSLLKYRLYSKTSRSNEQVRIHLHIIGKED